MVIERDWQEVKCLGSTVVGPRGQVVIPANARKEMEIDAGETLLVFCGPGKKLLVLLKTDALEEILSTMTEYVAGFKRVVQQHGSSRATGSDREAQK